MKLVCLIIHQMLLNLVCGNREMKFIMPEVKECNRTEDICIDIYKCPYYVYLLDKVRSRRPYYVISRIRTNQCGFIEDRPKVCCTPSQLLQDRTGKNQKPTSIMDHENLYLLPVQTCGHVKLFSRITHGESPMLGEFPWMAMIFYTTNIGPDFLCGGSLISDKYVLTAAHCIQENILGVRVGEHNIITTTDCERRNSICASPHQDFHIESIVIHPRYGRTSQANDIAIIRLSQPADLTKENVRPICLPLWNFEISEETRMTVAGWGITEHGRRSTVLQKAELKEVPLAECRRKFRNYAQILETQLCAGGKRRDSCSGDSGGPLFLIETENGTARYVQTGIVSYGAKICGTFGVPGIYTRVQSYVAWILNHIEP